MKAPKYFARGVQQCIDANINGFAVQLLAESFADDPAKFGGDNLVVSAQNHKGREVFMLLTLEPPTMADFERTGPARKWDAEKLDALLEKLQASTVQQIEAEERDAVPEEQRSGPIQGYWMYCLLECQDRPLPEIVRTIEGPLLEANGTEAKG